MRVGFHSFMKQEVSVKARNIYADWKKSVRKSKKSIRVITPYFDRSLIDLVKTSIYENKAVQVLTDVDTPNWIEALAQLQAAIKLIKMGVEVRSLEGLHAKVLLIDGKIKTVGSQNFTRRGKINSEVSMLLTGGDSKAEIILEEWWETGREVFVEDLEEILSELEPKMTELKRLAESLQLNLVIQQANLNLIRERRRLENLRNRAASSATSISDEINHVAFVEATLSGLYACNSQLILWKNGVSNETEIEMERLYFYPVFFFNTNKLAYCRVGKTRITYLSDSVSSTHSFMVGDQWISRYSVKFKTGKRGAEVLFTSNLGTLTVIFNDGELQFLPDDQNSALAQALENDQLAKKRFANRIFENLKFQRMSHLSINKEIAEEYFTPGKYYEIRVIEVYDNPILVISEY